MKKRPFSPFCGVLLTLLAAAACTSGPDGAEALFTRFSYAGRDARFERSFDPANEYLNPVLSGFHPDPSICRRGEDYFLVNSSFTFYPSIPIFHSRDLVHWRQIGFVLNRPSQVPLDSLRFNRAIYAPDISYNPHNDTFYVVNTCVDGIGNFVVKCRDPFAGEWSDPIPLPEVEGIDPSLFFDDDGKAYLCHNGMPPAERQWNSHRALWMREYDTATDRVTGESVLLLDGGIDFASRPEWLEGPHIYKKEGRYILLAAEGGTYENHSQVVLRADHVKGPYLPYSGNPVLTQRDLPAERPDKVTSTGHADLVETPEGEWYCLFLGCRPYADDFYNTGRETFLLPVRWKEGWPVILERGEAVPTVVRKPGLKPAAEGEKAEYATGNFRWETDFSEGLDLRWLMLRMPRTRWWRTGKEGEKGLTLTDNGHTLYETANPAFAGCRQKHTSFEVETELLFRPGEGKFAGLALFQNERHHVLFGKARRNGQTELLLVRTEKEPEIVASWPLESGEERLPVTLRIVCRGGTCDFTARTELSEHTCPGVDVRHLSTRTARGFNGVIAGLYTGGFAPAE